MVEKRVHIIVSGRVQGVFYRANTEDMAQKLGLKGWVRNTPDGTVEIVAEGKESKLRELAHWCRKGPPSAHVRSVNIEYMEPFGDFESFRIKYY